MDEYVRVSAAGLSRIKINDKYLILRNIGQFEIGVTRYSPFGGALSFDESSREFLEENGAVFEREDNDIRLDIPAQNYSIIKEWLDTRQGRETSPFRELQEELVDEKPHILESLVESDVCISYRGVTFDERKSRKPEANDKLTKYYFEIYDVKFSEDVERRILEDIEKPDSWLRLVTEEEIRAGETSDHKTIADNCLSLLDF
jgi:hypothetical protein